MATKSLLMQCLLGIQCKEFTMIAGDQTYTEGILVMKDDEDKLHQLADNIVMGMNGDAGDRAQFSQFVLKNIELYNTKNGYTLSPAAVTHFTRKNIMDAQRNGTPYIVNLLMAGFDDDEGGLLYTMDFLAACMRVPFAAHGIAGLLSISILSTYYKPDLTEEEAYEILKLCIFEIHKRLFMNLPNFCVKMVSKDGVKTLPIINPYSV